MSRFTRVLLVLTCALLSNNAARPAFAAPPPPQAQSLVCVSLPSADALSRFEASGLPVFSQDEDAAGAFVLTGADQEGLLRLTAAGLRHIVLDPDTAGATYYFAIVPPGRRQPNWSMFGAILFDRNGRRLIRSTPPDAERLVAQGVEIAQLSLEPHPLQRPLVSRPTIAAAITPDPLVQGMMNQVTAAELQDYVAQLSGDTPVVVGGTPYTIATRFTSSGTPIEKATQLVSEHMAGLGLTVESHTWNKSGYSNRNVIGQWNGTTTPDDIYVIGAHLDDMPMTASAPGADDNASGSAATLIAADILSQYQWGCTLRFAFWTGEEQGLLGSAVYAARARNDNETVRGYLNLDMVGYNSSAPRNVDLYYRVTPNGSEQIADTFIDVVSAYGLDLVPIKYNAATYSTGNRSDNKSFWDQGYPAILAIEDYQGGDFTPAYHTSNDKLSTLDLDYFTPFVKAAIGTFTHMNDCLLTGDLVGSITAAHDGSAIPGATVAMTDTHDLSYSASTDDSGDYDRTLPAATYDITVSAYGYLPATVMNFPLTTGGATQAFVLQAAPPVAPQVTTQMSFSAGDAVQLAWAPVTPNMTYAAYRGEVPYFPPTADYLQKSWEMPFPNPITYDDPAGSGNRFYAVVAYNAAGAEAPASRVGIFNFGLQPGE